MRNPSRLLSCLLLPALLVACGGEAPPVAAVASPALQTLTIAAGEGGAGTRWDGVVQALEQSVLSAQTAGRVIRLGADVDRKVAAGTVLLQLTSEEQSAAVETLQAQLRSAEAQLVDANARYARAASLVERQLVSRDDHDRVKAARDSAEAARAAAAAQLVQARQQLGYTTVRAPYAGVVAARQVELGETVSPGQPLFTLYAPGALRAEVQVPQSDAEAIRRDGKALVTLGDGREVQALRVIVFPSADPGAHSTAVRVLLPSVDAPPTPGQTVKVRFPAAHAPTGIWLPRTAVVERGELTGAYVVGAHDVQLRQLRLGATEGDRVQVLAGLSAGEQVASDPLAALQWLRKRQGAAERAP